MNRIYVISIPREQENSLNIIKGMIKVFTFHVYALLDLGATLSFLTASVANQFEIIFENLCEPFCVCTPVWKSVLDERVYHDFLVFINHKNTMDDLEELGMVDFDVILGIDWLHACYASIDCRTRVIKFLIPKEPVIE